ncbi:uncharacterized protein LOC115980566 [Quercus lobata]|uniref:uncharacterized protein LOC115980566 n=1 Tax=Quercus lobata TaxID=97700 RepID=UPI001244C9C9|nr:uncharacterized protein LOC115980566 [Quercus lobata]
MHAEEPLRDDASIKDFNGGIGCHIASTIEEALLLPRDMAEIKNKRKNELVIQNTFKLDEMLNRCYSQLDDERKQRASAVQTLTQSEQDLAAAKKKLLAEEQAHKRTDSALEGFQKQAEDQGKRLREANAELKAAREQVTVLKKHLEETQKLRAQDKKSREEAKRAKAEAEQATNEAEQATNEAEQKGYEIGVVETKETLRAEVLMVCRIYCAQTWDEALNRAGVKASSELRRPESVFYPEAIRTSAPPSSKAEDTPSTINPNEEVLPPSLPPPGQQEPAKENNAPPEAFLDKTTTASEAEVASQGFQQDLASTVMPTVGAIKDKEGVTTPEADKSASQAPKLQIKLKK